MLFVLMILAFGVCFVMSFTLIYEIGAWWLETDRLHEIIWIISFILSVVLLFGVDKISNMTYEESLKTGEWTLQALPDISPIKERGEVYLIFDTNEYLFNYQSEDGEFEIGKVNANKTKKHEGDYTPHIVRYTKYTRSKLDPRLRKFLLISYKSDPCEERYEIYIPEGTFVNITNIDFNKCIRAQTIYSY